MPKETKVKYNIADALKALDTLANRAKDASGKVGDAFKKAGADSKTFDELLKKIPGSTGLVGSAVKKLVVNFGPLSGLIVGATGAIGGLIANLIDLPSLFRNTAESMEEFRRQTAAFEDAQNLVSSFSDALVNAENLRQQTFLQLATAESKFRQVEFQSAQKAAEREISLNQEKLRSIEGDLQKSVDRRKSLRDKLAERLTEDVASGFQGPAGRRALSIGAAARRAASQGDVKRAEALEEAAKSAAEEAGNHNLFLRDQQRTRNAINASLQQQLAIQERIAAPLERAKKTLDDNLRAAQQRQIKTRETADQEALIQQKMSAQLQILQQQNVLTRAAQGRDEGARTEQRGLANLRAQFALGDQSAIENFVASFRQSINNLTDVSGNRAIQGELTKASRLLAGNSDTLNRILSGRGTGQDIQSLAQIVEPLQVALGRAEFTAQLRDKEGFENQFKFLEGVIGDFGLIIQGRTRQIENFGTLGTGVGAQGTAGTIDLSRDFPSLLRNAEQPLTNLTGAAAEAALKLREVGRINFGGQAPGVPKQPQPAVNQGAAVARPSAASVVANVNIKGGMIDPKTVDQIVDIVQRRLRTETTTGIA